MIFIIDPWFSIATGHWAHDVKNNLKLCHTHIPHWGQEWNKGRKTTANLLFWWLYAPLIKNILLCCDIFGGTLVSGLLRKRWQAAYGIPGLRDPASPATRSASAPHPGPKHITPAETVLHCEARQAARTVLHCEACQAAKTVLIYGEAHQVAEEVLIYCEMCQAVCF
jgi:hypothetical protein